MTDSLQNISLLTAATNSTITASKRKIKQELTKEEKKNQSRMRYMSLIERCKNGEYKSMEERRLTRIVKQPTKPNPELPPAVISEEKKVAKAMRLYTANKKYRTENREEYNTYMRIIMREKYRNNAEHRAIQVELSKLRTKKNRDILLIQQKQMNLENP